MLRVAERTTAEARAPLLVGASQQRTSGSSERAEPRPPAAGRYAGVSNRSAMVAWRAWRAFKERCIFYVRLYAGTLRGGREIADACALLSGEVLGSVALSAPASATDYLMPVRPAVGKMQVGFLSHGNLWLGIYF
jgi:hypothetical protein